jgi:ABC-type uncharacterized transport system permease subunit
VGKKIPPEFWWLMRLLWQAFKNNLDAHLSVPVNFYAAVIGMAVNNFLFLYGMWLMLFQGKEQNQAAFQYYLALVATVYTSWGILMTFAYGLRFMGETIDDGRLEPMMGTPRHPLLLVAIGESNPSPIGDFIQGIAAWGLLFYFSNAAFAWRSLLMMAVVILAFLGVFIFAGSIAFLSNRGGRIGSFLIESTLSLTLYPTGKMFTGNARYILYLTPAFLTGVLPMEVVEKAGLADFFKSFLLAALFFFLSLKFFWFGLKKYKAASLVGVFR